MKAIAAPLARRLQAAWATYETARRQGILHALPFLRRWHRLRQALEAAIIDEPFVNVLPDSFEAVIPLRGAEGGAR